MSNDNTKRQRRSGPVLRVIVWVVGVAVVLGVVLPAILMALQQQGLRRDRASFPPPGELFATAGTTMHLFCEGQSEPGGPTVVIDAGNASFSLDWVGIQRQLSDAYRICLYDRAGYGWSAPRSESRDADHVVEELRALLQAAGEDEPILLVGHSLGGVFARLYAARYRDDVAGLILIDTATDHALTPAFESQQRATMGFYEVMRFLSGSGLLRAVGPLIGDSAVPPNVRGLPEDVQPAYLALLLDPTTYETAVDELQMVQTSVRQANAALDGETPLAELPLLVLTAAMSAPAGSSPYAEERVAADPDQIAAQAALAQLSTRGERRMLGRSGHLVHLDAPDAIVAAVDDIYAIVMVGSHVR